MAWQSLLHQASCDSLPVPALHLHWPVMSWQAFLLDSHHSAALPIRRVNERVYMHTSISALRHSDLFQLKFESTSNWLGGTVLDGTRIQNCLFPFFSPAKIKKVFSQCVCAFNYFCESFYESMLSYTWWKLDLYGNWVLLFSSEEKQPLDVLNICRNNYSQPVYHQWPQWKW